ncbi:cell division protein ZapD [Ferrimonas sediminum]|uniref:Cell division protein ZapD n=1 Tax=Ferrimonas sediminum TaxID=718193 RepID=A0A1G8KGS5_9GAMM|nr:cell division protein ZapD [Ferrimonas sediminum]SDI42621.1 cell division protein ZapD [Ferrimonas sediminum]
MTQTTVFEHPLNERTRLYLRVEQLHQALSDAHSGDQASSHRGFFRTLFELCEVLERTDLKSDLGKQLDHSLTLVKQWQSQAGVDQQQLRALVSTLEGQSQALQQMERPGQNIKQDKFLSQIRQRISLAGGACGFDLPRLQYWLHLPKETRLAQMQQWTATLAPVLDAIELQLQLIRECSPWQNKVAVQGQFLHNAPQPLALLRLRLDNHYGCYPIISGHRNRFSINMMHYEQGNADVRNIPFMMSLSMESP